MKTLLAGCSVLALMAGCAGFGSGFRDEALRQAAGELREKIDGVRESIPRPDPVRDSAGYTVGALLAYVLGSVGKGFVRRKLGGDGGKAGV